MPSLRVASRVRCTQAEGPHRRYALWVAGCSIRCPGCCNPELFDANAGQNTRVEELLAELERARAEVQIEGVSVLGGEPMDQALALAALFEGVQAMGLGVLLFSGYTIAQLEPRAEWGPVWAGVDTLIDGRFEARRLESRVFAPRRFVGSTNQGIHHRTGRYADPELWRGEAGVEVHISPTGSVSVHGQPSLARKTHAKLDR